MPARTGRQFLDGLKEPRDIYVGADKVADVADHPAFRGAAEELAGDLRPAARRGRPLPGPRSRDRRADQRQPPDPALAATTCSSAHAALERLRRVQRGPDGPLAGLHERHLRRLRRRDPTNGRSHGNEAGAENLVAYQKVLRRNDLSLTHTIIHPTIDKALGDVPRLGNDVALHKVGETEHGIIVRGARILATLAPFADELAVYPGHPSAARAPTPIALAFCIPMTTPGLKFLCRDSFSQPAARLRPPALRALRRAGRLRHLRRRRGAAASGCSSTATSPSTTR